MTSKTYYVGLGSNGLIRRLDNLNFDPNGNTYTNWVDLVSNFNTSYSSGSSSVVIPSVLYDVMTIPGNKDKVFVVGQNNIYPGSPSTFTGIGYSTNAGSTWLTPGFPGAAIPNHISDYKIATELNFYFYEVWCVSSSVIYACGDSGTVIRSLDGGSTFTLHDVPYTQFQGYPGPISPGITSIHFESPSNGVIGSYKTIFTTTTGNGACTWLPTADLSIGTSNSGYVRGIYKKGNLIVAVTSGNIVCSTNGGTSWTQQHVWQELGNFPYEKNGEHLTWHYNQCNDTIYFRATGRRNEIVQAAYKFGSTNSFIDPVTNAVLTPTTAWSIFNSHVYSNVSVPREDYYAAHFYAPFEGFLGRTELTSSALAPRYALGYPRIDRYISNSEVLNVDQPTLPFAKNYVVTAIWTELDPVQYYKLIQCETNVELVVALDSDTSNLPNTIDDVLHGITIDGVQNDKCWTNKGPVTCPTVITKNVVTTAAQTIQDCNTYPCAGCFKLVTCEPEYDKNGQPFFPSINVQSNTIDLNEYLYQVFQFSEETNGFCPGKCFYLTKSIVCDPPPVPFPDTPYEVYDSCSECIPKCPVELNTRSVRPGFYTPGCPPDYTVKTSCMYAEQVYDEMVAIRYGINICCDHDLDRWDIKKQLLDLRSLYDECLCVSAICPVCVEPCNVSADLVFYVEEPMPPPPPPCDPPSDPITIDLGNDYRCYGFGLLVNTGAPNYCYPHIKSITTPDQTYDLSELVTQPINSILFNEEFVNALATLGITCSGAAYAPPPAEYYFIIYGSDVPILYVEVETCCTNPLNESEPICGTVSYETYDEGSCTYTAPTYVCYTSITTIATSFTAYIGYFGIYDGTSLIEYNVADDVLIDIIIPFGSVRLPAFVTWLQSKGYDADCAYISAGLPGVLNLTIVNMTGGEPVYWYNSGQSPPPGNGENLFFKGIPYDLEFEVCICPPPILP